MGWDGVVIGIERDEREGDGGGRRMMVIERDKRRKGEEEIVCVWVVGMLLGSIIKRAAGL